MTNNFFEFARSLGPMPDSAKKAVEAMRLMIMANDCQPSDIALACAIGNAYVLFCAKDREVAKNGIAVAQDAILAKADKAMAEFLEKVK